MVTIQFSRQPQFFSHVIAVGTRSWASHVDFVMPDGQLLGAVAREGGGGVLLRPMHPLESYARIERYRVDAPNSQGVLSYAMSQRGKPYDWGGVFNFIDPNRDWQDDSAWFCSELVAQAFLVNNCPLIRAPAKSIAPGDLLLSLLLTPIGVLEIA